MEYNILQVGYYNWKKHYCIPASIKWKHILPVEAIHMASIMEVDTKYDFIIVDSIVDTDYILFLEKKVQPHRLIYHYTINLSDTIRNFFLTKKAIASDLSNPETIIYKLDKVLHSQKYHVILGTSSFRMIRKYTYILEQIGSDQLLISGAFGEHSVYLGSYKEMIELPSGHSLEIWPIFETIGNVYLEYEFVLRNQQSDGSENLSVYGYDNSQCTEPLTLLVPDTGLSILCVSIKIKGEGKVILRSISIRQSFQGLGYGLIGGQRMVSKRREEIFYYFYPNQDSRSLVVFFANDSDKKDFNIMSSSIKHNYLLIFNPYINHNYFYISNLDIEEKIYNIIKSHIKLLNVSQESIIFSGIEVGSFAALYYSSKIIPGIVLVGNPILNIGTLALHESTIHPRKFSYVLDFLKFVFVNYSCQSPEELNEIFWTLFKSVDWSKTSFSIAEVGTNTLDDGTFTELYQYLFVQNRCRSLTIKQLDNKSDRDNILFEWFHVELHNRLNDSI